jgi:hypothetical protein
MLALLGIYSRECGHILHCQESAPHQKALFTAAQSGLVDNNHAIYQQKSPCSA